MFCVVLVCPTAILAVISLWGSVNYAMNCTGHRTPVKSIYTIPLSVSRNDHNVKNIVWLTMGAEQRIRFDAVEGRKMWPPYLTQLYVCLI